MAVISKLERFSEKVQAAGGLFFIATDNYTMKVEVPYYLYNLADEYNKMPPAEKTVYNTIQVSEKPNYYSNQWIFSRINVSFHRAEIGSCGENWHLKSY